MNTKNKLIAYGTAIVLLVVLFIGGCHVVKRIYEQPETSSIESQVTNEKREITLQDVYNLFVIASEDRVLAESDFESFVCTAEKLKIGNKAEHTYNVYAIRNSSASVVTYLDEVEKELTVYVIQGENKLDLHIVSFEGLLTKLAAWEGAWNQNEFIIYDYTEDNIQNIRFYWTNYSGVLLNLTVYSANADKTLPEVKVTLIAALADGIDTADLGWLHYGYYSQTNCNITTSTERIAVKATAVTKLTTVALIEQRDEKADKADGYTNYVVYFTSDKDANIDKALMCFNYELK